MKTPSTEKFNSSDFEIIKREAKYEGMFCLAVYTFRHRLFNGGWSEIYSREVLERLSAAAVLPYDPKLDRVILIRQFRPGALKDPASPWTIEIPAGVIEHNNETPDSVAIREAKEEAGCDVTQLEYICEYYVSPGGSNEYLHLYYGQIDASQVGGVHGLEDENEDIKVLNLSTDEAFQLLEQKKIKNSPAIISLQWLKLNRDRLRQNA